MTKVLSLGGSIVAPEKPDSSFIKQFVSLTRAWLEKDATNRVILVVGGGGPARAWQNAYKDVSSEPNAEALDWIGIMATRLNAQLIRSCFLDLCPQDVVYDPSAVQVFTGRVLVASGWKPGWSTDFDAVLLAERFNADTVVNLSNIAKVYTGDPKLDPNAKPIDSISWADFKKIVGEEWVPGKNTPFDPVASKKASELGLKVICAAGKDLDNLQKILDDKEFVGTLIGA